MDQRYSPQNWSNRNISPLPLSPSGTKSLLTLDQEVHGVPGGGALAGEPGAGVGPGVFSLQAGEDQLVPGHTEAPVRQGPALPPPGETGGGLS